MDVLFERYCGGGARRRGQAAFFFLVFFLMDLRARDEALCRGEGLRM